MSVNSSRGTCLSDEVASISETYNEANGYYSYRGTNSDGDDVFEPADQHKGNLARALLYVSVPLRNDLIS
jgi:endonuclease I